MAGKDDWLDTVVDRAPKVGAAATLGLGLPGFGAMGYEANAIIPAPATFGIWGVIYTGMGALFVYQALPSQEHNPRFERARPWLAALAGLAAKKARQVREEPTKSRQSGARTLAKFAGGLAIAGAAWLAPILVRWGVRGAI